jgi:hypothetical protein
MGLRIKAQNIGENMNDKEAIKPETPTSSASPFERFVSFLGWAFRRNFQCRFGVHWGIPFSDIIKEHTCPDCGDYSPAIKWPRAPVTKPPPVDDDDGDTIHSLRFRVLKARAELLEEEVRKLNLPSGPCTR